MTLLLYTECSLLKISKILKNTFSQAEKEKYWDKIRPVFLRFYAFATQYHLQNPELLKDMYNYHLATKGILLSASNKIKQQILGSNDEQLKQDYKQWVSQKKELIRLYTYTREELEEQEIDLRALETSTNELEKKLSENALFREGYEEGLNSGRQEVFRTRSACLYLDRARTMDLRRPPK